MIQRGVFINAHAFAIAGVSVYFPVVWSTYNPLSIAAVDCLHYGLCDKASLNPEAEPTRTQRHR